MCMHVCMYVYVNLVLISLCAYLYIYAWTYICMDKQYEIITS